MEKKLFHFQIAVKSAVVQEDKKSVLIQGFASTPDLDRYHDIVEPSAFAGALTLFMKNPSLLRSHDSDRPAGNVTQMRITDQGLWIEAMVTEEETVKDVLENRMRALSIGYIPLESTLQHEDGTPFNSEKDSPWDKDIVRVIKKLDLIEISIVSTPANGNALFTIAQSVKSYFNQLAIKSMQLEKKETEEVIEKPGEEIVPETPKEEAVEAPKEETEINENTPASEAPLNEAEKTGETPVADSGEAKTGEEPNADAKAEEKLGEVEPDEDGPIGVDEESAKSLPVLVKVGLIKEVKSAEAIILPKSVANLIAKLTKSFMDEVKRANELEEKLKTIPEKRALAMQGQFQEPEKPEKDSSEASPEFKKLFGMK